MIEPTNVEIDGIQFNISAVDVLEAIVLDKKITELVLPVITTLLSSENVDVKSIKELKDLPPEMLALLMDSILGSFSRMDGSFLTELTQKLLKVVITVIPGKGAVTLESRDNMNIVFAGKYLTLYKLLLKVMEVNKFTPFAILGSGLGMPKTPTTTEPNTSRMKKNVQ